MNANIHDKSSPGLSLQSEPQLIVCPKCQYQRTAADHGPDWRCPSCGVAYSKATPPSVTVAREVNSGRGAGGSREINRDELETATPGAISLSMNGRIGRLRYLAYSWPLIVLSGLGMVAAVIHNKLAIMLMIPVGVLWFWVSLRLMALRLHDVNRSAKWVLALVLLPGAGFAAGGPQIGTICAAIFWILALLLIVLPGSESDNDYGPPPGPNTTLVNVGGGIFLFFMALGVVGNIKYMKYMRSGKLNPLLSRAQGAADEQPGSGVQSPKEKALAALRQTVREVSLTLPKKIDAVTTLTKAEVSGDTYKIYYSMDPGVQLDASRKGIVEQAAKLQICGSAKRILVDNGITVEYEYTFSGPSGREKMLVSVPSGSCL